MKPKFYYCELYRMNYWFCTYWKPEDFSKLMAKHFGYTTDMRGKGGSTMYCYNDKGDIIVIWTDPSEKKKGALVHECVHAANITLKERGVKADFDNDEPVAYLTGLLYEKAKS